MHTYGQKGHIQECWIKDHIFSISTIDDIYNFILQINFQLVRTDNMKSLQQNWRFLLKHLFSDKNKYINEIIVMCKLLLYTRDIHYGKGERKLSYMMLFELYQVDNQIAVILFEWFVRKLPNKTTLGCWKDVKRFAEYIYTETGNDNHGFIIHIINISNKYLTDDYDRICQIYDLFKDKSEERIKHYIKNNIELSLTAKWLPRKSKNNKKYAWLFEKLADTMFKHYFRTIYTEKNINNKRWIKAVNKSEMKYRKMLSFVNKHLNVVEILQTSHKTNKIDFIKVPSLAKTRYHRAFLKPRLHPGDVLCSFNYKKYISIDCENNTIVSNQPLYEIVKNVIVNKLWIQPRDHIDRIIVNKIWNSKKININHMENIAIVDMSQSMNGLPLYNAISLGIYISEHNHNHFKNKLLTFGNQPRYIKFDENMDICDKVRLILSENNNIHSDLYGVINMLIDTVKVYKLPKYELKKYTLTILSDMQIENNVTINDANNKSLNDDYKQYTYKPKLYIYNTIKTIFKFEEIEMPQIVFWNLQHNNGFPISILDMHNYENVLMLSGFNEKVLRIFKGDNTKKHTVKEMDPSHNILFKILSNKRYDFVNKEILSNILL